MTNPTRQSQDVRRGRSVVYSLHTHLVFVQTCRPRVFTDAMLTRCEQVMREVCADSGADLAEFNDESDHEHLLVRYPPQVRLSALVGPS